MQTYIVTVTYGDRFKHLQFLIEHAFIEGVDKIIIVNNHSESYSTKKMNALKDKRIKIIHLSSNTGSANGYKQGLIEALKDPFCEFIWLMDDDNMPCNNSLTHLKKKWNNEKPEDATKLCLLSYRKDREIFKEAVQLKKPSLMLGLKNSFRGFHIANKPYSIILKTKKRFSKKKPLIDCGPVSVAPYSGMFFHKSLIDIIGLPDSKYFLYSDDYDFSYRITKYGGRILLIIKSELIDNEMSWHLKKKWWSSSLFESTERDRVYYALRNCVYFESTQLVDNRLVYYSNMIIYILLLKILSLIRNDTKRFNLILNAVKDGLNKNLIKK